MNERIQILAGQAEDYADGIVDQGGEFHEAYTKKFAELIVKECVTALWTDECVYSDLALEEFEKNSAKIELHFGDNE
jgi:hypothetical protein